MPTASTQTVIIEFQADYSALETGIDVLERTGKVDADLANQFRKTNVEIKAQGQALTATAGSANNNTNSFAKLSQLMAQFPKSGLNRFLLQVGNELSAAGVKAEDFKKKLDPKDAISKTQSLKNELKLLREQMQQVAVTSGVTSEAYKKLSAQAGHLDDTIKDVNNDIANAGSDTRGIDNVVGSISALAGGYSAVQGAAALFGQESEDLQKALLKVNAAMAIANGIQQVQTALTKQGSLSRLADVAATSAQVAVQKIYTFVTGEATAATTAFKVALAATGIGLVIVLFVAFADALKSTTSELDNANKAIDYQNSLLESNNQLLDRQLALRLAQAEKEGKTESELTKIRGKSLQAQIHFIIEQNKLLAAQRDALDNTSEAYGVLNAQIEKNNEILAGLNNDVLIAKINAEKQAADEQKKAQDEAAQRAKEAADKAREQAKKNRAAGFSDFKAGIELQLLEAEKGSIKELDLRKKLARAQLQIDLETDGLTQNQRKLLIQKFFKERRDLEKGFNAQVIADASANEKARLERSLLDLNLAEEDKLQVKIDYLRISADAEIREADGNAEKIRLINAKLNSDIATAKIESIRKTAEEEARITAADGGVARRALERVAANEKQRTEVRVNAITELGAIEQAAIDKQIAANRKSIAVQGSDQRALDIEYRELLDKKAAAAEDTEAKITAINKAAAAQRQADQIAYVQATIAGLQQLADIAAGIQENQQQAASSAIDTERKRIDELLKAGAISEKEAERRNKKVDAEERAAKNRAAQQQKKLAVFNAFLAIPQAFIAGLTAPFPVGGPIYGAVLAGLAAIQASVVASRPVPKFATGKKGSYSGLGIIGDAGAELLERSDGSMHIATKPELVYLGQKDKVFTAGETKRMMPHVNREALVGAKAESINYDKMAAAMWKNYKPSTGSVVNIDKDFISESVAGGLAKSRYFGKYYSSK